MKLLFSLMLLVCCSKIFAIDISLLQNNKEAYSRLVGNKQKREINVWLQTQNQSDLKTRTHQFLKDSIDFYERDGQCELKLIHLMIEKAIYYNLIKDRSELSILLNYIRSENQIDDIFLMILQDLLEVDNHLSDLKDYVPNRPINATTDITREIDTSKVYAQFKVIPDEKRNCSISNWRNIINSLDWARRNNRDILLKKLNYLAYQNGDIELKTYQTIDVLRKYQVIDWKISLYQYLDILKNAKDKLRKTITDPNIFSDFTSKFISRKEKVTHRERIYIHYSSTQVMLLADIINKTSRGLDAKRISINIEHSDMPSESEIYVLSPMERYRLSIKMLKKDMAEAMRSELFQGKRIEYEDLVSAAFETGLVEAKDLEMILEFEEFWNPQIPRWKMYANFAFQMAGSATFYLPVPFNVLGALALAITQTKVINQNQQPDPNDNWNVVL